jgi:hypothetical protein
MKPQPISNSWKFVVGGTPFERKMRPPKTNSKMLAPPIAHTMGYAILQIQMPRAFPERYARCRRGRKPNLAQSRLKRKITLVEMKSTILLLLVYNIYTKLRPK